MPPTTTFAPTRRQFNPKTATRTAARKPPKNYTASRFGAIFVIGKVHSSGGAKYLCRCDCGNQFVKSQACLSSPAKSCGCMTLKFQRAPRKSLGHSSCRNGQKQSPTYNSWRGMKNRCTQKTHRAYKNYGGRGIAFCERWVSYQNFVADMGERPEGTSLDRIDPNGNYEPLNCRWISGESQSFNKRSTIILTFNGKTQNTKEWGKELGIKPKTIAERFRKGWPVERILGVEKVTA